MHAPTSAKSLPPAIADRLEREIAEITRIYDRLYQDRQLDLVLFQGQNPVWSEPEIIEGEMVFRAQHLTADYLGRISRPGPHPGAGKVTVILRIPRAPTPGEEKITDMPWKAPTRSLRMIFGLAPMVYEQIRYQVEMIRKRRAGQHLHRSLSRGTGTGFLPLSQEPRSAERPAVLIGFHWLEVGGAEKLGFDCVKWALEAGLRVFVVASVPSLQRLADKLPDHPDVTFIRLDRYLPHHLWPQFITKLAVDENIRLIHVHHCTPLYESLPQLRVMAPWVKVIDSTHIVELADGGYPRISGVWSNFIDIHHVISGELRDYYRDYFHVLHKVRLGRMLDRRAEGEVHLPPVNLKAGQKSLQITFVGRMYYQKRPVIVVETMRALADWAKKNGVELKCTIVGEGSFEGTVATLVKRFGLVDTVDLRPAGTDVPALLAKSDILLLPSNNEGLALVCYEAIEQGCIPISTDVGSQNEIVPDALRVPVAPYRSVRETVRTIDHLWRDGDFLATQEKALHEAWTRLVKDPTAREILLPLYQETANSAVCSPAGINRMKA